MSRKNIYFLCVTGILAALGTAIYMTVPEIPVFGPLKLGFHDIPSIIGGALIGTPCGILIQIIMNLIHLTVSSSMGFGELINVLIGSAVVYTYSGLYRFLKKKIPEANVLIVATVGTGIISVVWGLLVNIAVDPPYMLAFNMFSVEGYIGFVTASVWLNLFKFTVVSAMASIIIFPLSRVVKFNHDRSHTSA